MAVRIGVSEALSLFEEDLFVLRREASLIRDEKHPDRVVTFVVDRNINYTNVCVSSCRFCAFHVKPGDPKGYVISKDEVFRKIEEAISLGATSILIQGGLNPEIGLDYITDLFRSIKKRFSIHIHGLSPPEIVFYARKEGISIADALDMLVGSGLDTIPGGGAEILSDEIRSRLSPKKCTASEWLEVMREAHRKGIRTSATMMFGHIEEPRHIVEHLQLLRGLQDETGGFTAFIPWTFQPWKGGLEADKRGACYYLRVLAISRIFLDNFQNVQASWVTQGSGIAQLALHFGANDFGSSMIEENVVRAAGVSYRISVDDMVYNIRKAGFIPAKRDVLYNILEIYS